MAVFIIGPAAGAVIPVTIGAAALLMLFELAIIYKLLLSTRDFERTLATFTMPPETNPLESAQPASAEDGPREPAGGRDGGLRNRSHGWGRGPAPVPSAQAGCTGCPADGNRVPGRCPAAPVAARVSYPGPRVPCMERYAALLRGINVGGHRKIPMAGLRDVMGELGWERPETHLQSGNAVFSAPEPDQWRLAAALEAAVERRFGFPVQVLVRSGAELRDTAARCPFTPDEPDPAKVHVFFADRAPDPERLARLDPARFAPDAYHSSGREVYCHFPNGSGRSRLPGALATALGAAVVTARNRRTVDALVALTR